MHNTSFSFSGCPLSSQATHTCRIKLLETPDKSVLRPKKLERIYDVVEAAGIDVSAWHQGKGDFASNPNFCYRWAFEGEKTALLCLWLHAIEWVDGAWVCEDNARAKQLEREAAGADHWDQAVRNRTKRWAKSAIQLDDVLKKAYWNKLDVRVCIIDTRTRAAELETNSADYRGLDPLPWRLTYDMMTGDYNLRRDAEGALEAPEDDPAHGIFEAPVAPLAAVENAIDVAPDQGPNEAPSLPEITETSYGVGVVDQFIVDDEHRDPVAVERYERERSAAVRQMVMARSKGRCEWCGQPGFIKHDGQIYLESHHVVPLFQEGDDSVENVIALCPNDHRMAHYAANRDDLAIAMLLRVEERLKAVAGAIREE
jgi:hypothetical protein